MADENTETTTEQTEARPKKGGIMGMLPMIGGIIAGGAIGVIVGLVVLGPRLAPASPAPGATAHQEAKKDEHDEHGEKKTEAMSIYQIDNLVLNPAASNGTRFLLLSVALDVKDEAALAMVKGHDAEMRDLILRLFGSKTAEQVAEATSRESLRTEVMDALSKVFPAGTIRKVYFPQFVIQ